MRKNRRRGSRPWIAAARRGVRLVGGVAVIAAAVLGGRATLAWVEAHPYFAVREIDVEGAGGRLDAGAIVGWAGLTPGMSVWRVNERRSEERLLAHPRIRAASVKRRLPGQATIRVDERRPLAVLLGSPPLLVDGEGVAFPPCAGEALDGLPYVTGLADDDPFSPAVAERLRGAARVVALWQARDRLPLISEVRAEPDELVVYTVGMPLAVRFGLRTSSEDLARLGALLDLWRGREAQMAAIDLSLPGEAVVRLRGAERRTHGRSSTT